MEIQGAEDSAYRILPNRWIDYDFAFQIDHKNDRPFSSTGSLDLDLQSLPFFSQRIKHSNRSVLIPLFPIIPASLEHEHKHLLNPKNTASIFL